MPPGRPPEIGKCIYCGTTKPPLTDEHVIGKGIGGDLVLAKATCAAHADITSNFEGSVFGNTWRLARMSLGFRPSHRSRRRREYPITITRAGQEMTVKVPIEDYLAILSFPVYDPPGRLIGKTQLDGVTIHGIANAHLGKITAADFAKKYHVEGIATTVSFVGHAFPRMLAKIGHAYAIRCAAEQQIPALQEAYVLPSILGQTSDVAMWVGSSDERRLVNIAHRHALKLWVHNGEVHVRIALFAQFGAPEYLVLVGKI